VDAVLADYRSAPISEAEKVLFAVVETANETPCGIDPADLERAKAVGWSESALYDAITVCALFNFYNLWVDATGVAELSEEGYAASGRRLAREGYMGPVPEGSAPEVC
jgi:alkylhydroperoxidase family enzyme